MSLAVASVPEGLPLLVSAAQLAATRNGSAARESVREDATEEPARRANSIIEAAQFAIEDAAEPLSLSDVLDRVPRYGKAPGGKRPGWLLSNLMSAEKHRFQSVKWRGRKRWWLANKAVPEED